MTDSCENEVCGAARPCDEQVYRSIVREFPTGLVVACLQDNRVVKNWVGAGVAKIYGYSVEEMEQDPMLWFSTVHPSDAPDVRVALNSITADEPHTSEFRIFRKDGQMRWVRETCRAPAFRRRYSPDAGGSRGHHRSNVYHSPAQSVQADP